MWSRWQPFLLSAVRLYMMRLDLIKTRVEIFSIAGFNISMAHIAGTIWYPNPKICIRVVNIGDDGQLSKKIAKLVRQYHLFSLRCTSQVHDMK